MTSDDGMPEFYPNTFLTAKIRGENRQYNTLASAADSVKVLRAWELCEGINIVERMLTCEFLKDFEIDSLSDAAWCSYKYLKEKINQKNFGEMSKGKIRSLSSYRRQEKAASENKKNLVAAGTAGCRIVYIVRYLKYVGTLGIQNITDAIIRHSLVGELENMTTSLSVRAPDAFGGNFDAEYQRLGLTYEVEGLLRKVIEPGHNMNPWSEKVQQRNCMVIKVLLGLGVRGGELLNLRIEDLDLRQNKVFIRRLPDNPDDPRLYEPNVKTLPRDLRMKEPLADTIHKYIANDRRMSPGARKHDFLVVSSEDGAPLSRTSYNNIFASVRKYVPGIPHDFGGHLCRHTWNDRFSDFCDMKGVPEENERKIRCKIMGWVPGSHMAAIYTKRSTQTAVDEYMLGQQELIASSMLGELLHEITIEDE